MTEDQARAVVLLQAFECADEGPLWTAEDRGWATRAARQAVPDAVAPERFVVERARLALQRLAPRDAGVRRALAQRLWSPRWPLAALGVGTMAGVLSDALVAGPYFNLLSPLFWGLLAWNLALYLLLAVTSLRPAAAGPVRGGLAWGLQRGLRRLGRVGPLADFASRWARVSLALGTRRVAVLLHLAAAGLALGLIGGLMLRGLVFDYRAGWASTLLQPDTLRQALDWGLAPAQAVTGIAPPDAAAFDALRVTPGQPATVSAAPWIVLMVAQLVLVVLLPRLALATHAAWRARQLAARFALPLTGPYFERLRPVDAPQGVWVLPHARTPEPAAVLGLRALMARVWGDALALQIAPALAYGDEDEPPPAPQGWRPLVTVDLAATPEPDTHGRLLKALAARGGPPVLLLADSSGFLRRFGAGPRLEERVSTWRNLARDAGAALVVAALDAPDLDGAERAWRQALDSV
ncbi:MAG: DUF2868 domain-containing protein [Rubrivivax sp.]|nr:DUF2868 domain-containing protein [Rubrivivax sp.]